MNLWTIYLSTSKTTLFFPCYPSSRYRNTCTNTYVFFIRLVHSWNGNNERPMKAHSSWKKSPLSQSHQVILYRFTLWDSNRDYANPFQWSQKRGKETKKIGAPWQSGKLTTCRYCDPILSNQQGESRTFGVGRTGCSRFTKYDIVVHYRFVAKLSMERETHPMDLTVTLISISHYS